MSENIKKNTVSKDGVVKTQAAIQANIETAVFTKPAAPEMEKETGGVSGPEPTRYGDWEHKGRCYDF